MKLQEIENPKKRHNLVSKQVEEFQKKGGKIEVIPIMEQDDAAALAKQQFIINGGKSKGYDPKRKYGSTI